MLKPRAAAGFTLVEVMVTVFVVAIGLLAAAGLQAISKKAAFDAMQRSTATVLAQDMIERMRANSTQVSAYASRGEQLTTAPAAASCGSDTGTACLPETLVDYDLARWWDSLDGASEKIAAGGTATANAGGLRSPAGCIRSIGNRVEVVVAWRGMSLIRQATGSDDPDDPTSDPCGEAPPAVGDYEKDGDQSFRRVLRLQAHIQSRG